MQTFQCPKCGAPVNYQRDVVGANLTAKCSYCNSSLSVPHGNQPAHVININVGSATANNATKWVLLFVLIPVIGVVIAVIAVGGFLLPLLRQPSLTTSNPVTPPRTARSNPSGGKETAPGFATLQMKFGEEGTGPGMFKDARSIAVDGAGNIYVGDYTGGRIQVFDSTGKFITQWLVDTKMPLRGLAADRKGTVYVVQSGEISRYQGETGNLLGKMSYSGGWGFDDLICTPDGGLVGAWYKNRDDIVRFNSAGQVTQTIRGAISTASGDSELDTRVAVDGLGNIYALGTFNNAVFKFGPDGKFITRFGDAGDQAGQFRAPSAIAVDGKGRVYVNDIKGIQIFDSNGRYLTVFKPEGSASGLLLNDKGELFIAARSKVLRYKINE